MHKKVYLNITYPGMLLLLHLKTLEVHVDIYRCLRWLLYFTP